jgi:hypothetical protein
MRNCILIISIGLLALTSCKEITFSEPQPVSVKKLKTFPVNLIGKYIVTEDSNLTTDTVLIYKDFFQILDSTEKNKLSEKSVLSDSLILKKYKGYYFLNFSEKKRWALRVFRQEKNKDITLFTIDLSDDTTLAHLQKELKPILVKEDSDTYFEVRPSPEPKVLLKFIQEHYNEKVLLKRLK